MVVMDCNVVAADELEQKEKPNVVSEIPKPLMMVDNGFNETDSDLEAGQEEGEVAAVDSTVDVNFIEKRENPLNFWTHI